ncbi:MAG: hypothetical protein ACLTMP_06660 [Eggerthella lenta]
METARATRRPASTYLRDYPFKGGRHRVRQLADLVDEFSFSDEDVAYLGSLDAPGGGKLFKPEFLDYLRTFELRVDIDAVLEGTVVFPHEPLVRVTGPIMDCQLIETALLNCVNFETLIATKAARVCQAAQAPVAEFGLRRAQGAGGNGYSRAAVVGGASRRTCWRASCSTSPCRARTRTRGSCRFPTSSRRSARTPRRSRRTACCSWTPTTWSRASRTPSRWAWRCASAASA